jgi:uncharacterized damage-inducible protein DinB
MSHIEFLADQLERGYQGGAWHGTALAEILREVDETHAASRPIEEAHTIWEIVRHITFWNDASVRRLNGEALTNVPDELDWSKPPAPSAAAWKHDKSALEQSQNSLRTRLLELDDSRLEAPVAGSDPTVQGMIAGMIQHLAYHTGQIVLLRRVASRS